jgi:hypothetical protein
MTNSIDGYYRYESIADYLLHICTVHMLCIYGQVYVQYVIHIRTRIGISVGIGIGVLVGIGIGVRICIQIRIPILIRIRNVYL